jgi:hypothetical protein
VHIAPTYVGFREGSPTIFLTETGGNSPTVFLLGKKETIQKYNIYQDDSHDLRPLCFFMYAIFQYIFTRDDFQDLELMTSWSQDNNFTTALGLPSVVKPAR